MCLRDLADGYGLYSIAPTARKPKHGDTVSLDAFRSLFVDDATNLKKSHFVLLEYSASDDAGCAELLNQAKETFEQLGLCFDIASVGSRLSVFLYKSSYAAVRGRLSLNGLEPC